MTGAGRPWPKTVAVDPGLAEVLPGADFSDAFALTIDDPSIDAMMAAKRALASPPAWARPLMLFRDVLVTPLGLKTRYERSVRQADRIGIFPVVSQSPERVVLGFDDWHLDFRAVVDVAVTADDRRVVTATTLVRTNNTLGRIYLRTVMPIHKMIVPGALAQVARVR